MRREPKSEPARRPAQPGRNDVEVRLCRQAATLSLRTLIAASLAGLTIDLAAGAELPIPCGAGTCGPAGPVSWVTSGQASATATANSLTIDQTTDRLVLNWQQFNIGPDGQVTFHQPDVSSVALNKIFQGDPVRILGTLQANGSVYLVNQNGILFGPNARVNVGGLLASTLDLTPDAVNGLLEPAKNSAPAFTAFVDAAGNAVSGDVRVEAGAQLTTAEGGQLFLFGANVTNAGTLSAPGGQIILAAGDSVYLAGSQDANLRGLLVEVGHGGAATNFASGIAAAARGNVTLVGLMVNQEGRASATTSVRENGSVRLLARDGGQVLPGGAGTKATNGGTLRLGSGSLTTVSFEHNDDDKTVDATPQARSFVELEGRTVSLESQSQVIAPSGTVQITAREDGTPVSDFAASPGQGRVVVASDATIDVSGAQIERSVDTNILRVELRGSQLADSPEQRDGPLRGQTAYVDIRRSGTRADGTSWVGSPIGDLAGDVATIQKTVEERSLLGGQVQIAATGAVVLESGSAVDVSGGGINFTGGLVKTTQVLGTDGRVYDIGDADRDRSYAGLTDAITVDHPKWGVTETFQTFWPSQGVYEAGYYEGKDAGTVSITAPRAVLDGAARGQAIAGLHQRTTPTAVPANALYRNVGELPLAGRLVLGTANATGGGGFLIAGVQVASGPVLGGLQGPTGAPFNPLLDPLPDELATVRVRPELFGPDGLGALTVYANEGVTIDQSSVLNLGNAGQLNVTAGFVDIQGRVLAPSGAVSLTAQPTIVIEQNSGLSRVALGATAAIDVAGRWINDAPSPNAPAQHDPLVINGGSVALSAKGGAALDLLAGSRIDVSGGANRQANGTIAVGRGGSLSISAAPTPVGAPAPVTIESQLFAHAFKDGGRLSLTLSAFCLSDTDCSDAATGSYVDPLGTVAIDGFRADLATLTLDGFESVSLASNLGGIDVAAGTRLQPRQHNYLWALEPTRVLSGTPLSAFTTVGLLPDPQRQPFNLSLTAAPQSGGGGAILNADYAQLGFLHIGTDAVLDFDVGASLTLQSSTGIVVDGALSAPAGSILLDVTTGLQLQEFVANQGIWLGDRARLDVAGIVQALPDDFGRLRGSVLDGGSITLRAERGYVATAQQSVLDASGTSADLVVGQTSAGSGGLASRVASAGGTIEIAAAEGLLLSGAMYAPAGQGSTAAGGSLRVTLDGNLHGSAASPVPIYPSAPRELHLVSGQAPVLIGPGQALPTDFYGRGLLPIERVAAGGFSEIELDAMNLFDPLSGSAPVSTGSIVFDGSMTLQAAAGLRLNTPRLVGAPGSNVTLSAPYVGLGYDDIAYQAQTGAGASPGSSALTVNGGLIDLIGTLGLDGFGSTKLASSGDIRLRGVESTSADGSALPLAGQLHSQGAIDFLAQQLYASTLTDYQVLLDGPDHTVISLHPSPGTPGTVLSAGARITLTADEVSQGGVLRAPLGEIVLQAQDVTLADGSVTSTSASGTVIPFGTLQVGADWTYQLPRGQTALYTTSGPPAQRLELNAQNIAVAPGAKLDLSGGGNLVGYEFVPGVSGTKDVLANGLVAGQFAIVPALGAKFAPIDPAAQVGFGYQPGDTVYLAGHGDLPAGEYAILPARYALLPGGYLVRPVTGYTDIQADEAVQRLDGSVVISGTRGVAGTALRDSRTSGFAVYSSEQIAQQARYDLTLADDFFSARAAANNAPLPRVPRDGGQLQLIATAHLDLEGLLSASVGTGGRGSRVDVSAAHLHVIADGVTGSDPSEVTISASQLDALGAESLLLGGLRTTTQTGTGIDTTADQVTVDGGVTLDAPTLTLVARNQLEIRSGATLQASGAAAGAASALTLSGDGALVRVSTADLPEVTRTGATGVGGNLLIGAGARISSSGSALLEASGTVDAKAAFDLAGGSLGFSVARLGFGDVDPTYTGLALSATELSSLNLRELSLTSATDIDFFRTAPAAVTDDGSTTLRVNGVLALTAQSLNVHDAPTATIGADRLVLSGNGSAASVTGNGKLVLDANEITWGGGALATSGVNSVTLSAASQFRAEKSGVLSAAADVKVLTPEVVTGNGADFAIRASGAVDVLGTGAPTSTAAVPAGVGGSLLLEGSRVALDTRLTLPSGLVKLQADAADTGGAPSIALTAAATIDVSGFKEIFDGQVASGDGGLVRMESGLGGISLAAGSLVDVSAGTGQGNAGRLDVRAPSGAIALNGALHGNGADGSGEIAVDGASIPDLGSLNRQLNGAGFDRSRVFHQRGAGDLVVAAGADSVVRAANVAITADGGSVIVLGGIDASGANGGAIKLAARDNVDVSGFLRADSSASAAEGGRVDLWTDAGGIFLRDGASVSVAAGNGGVGGLVSVRAPRQSLLSVLDADASNDLVSLGGQISGNRELDVEGYQRYTVASGVIDATYTSAISSNPLYADADTFMQSSDLLVAALTKGAAPTVINPGIELQSAQGLTLAADWNLAAWRFNGQPGVLTLRAGGDLSIQKSLSDGFAAITGLGAFEIPDVATRSWSYRLVAGSDLNSSDVLAVKTAGTNLGAGKLTVAGGRISAGTTAPVPIMVRTGTGNIDIATAADFVLTNRASVIYTAGANSGLGVPLPVLGTALRKYPTDGGDISLSIGGDIVGAPTNQLVTGWLWRSGRRQDLQFPQATGWNVNYQRFEQGIGALSGGNVTVRADGNIRDLSASVATIGRQVGGTTAATSVVEETGGGTLAIESGGDLTGGSYYDGKGTASVRSWGAIGINAAAGAVSGLAPTLALGDTVMNVASRRDLTLEAVVNPFLLPQAVTQTGASSVSYFSSYSARSALHTVSTGGDTRLINTPTRTGGLVATMGSSVVQGRGTFTEAPATVDIVTLAGDMSIGGGFNVWPSPIGDLRVFANGNLNLAFPVGFPDVDPATLPTIASPGADVSLIGAANRPTPGVPHVPIHSAAFRPDGQDDPEPVRIVATGDILGATLAYVGKPLRLIAGGDITDLYASIENLNDSSLSLISAQGNILYRTPRHPVFGYIVDNIFGVQVEGPGQLALQAGGSIDLGSSLGVTSAGNFLNPALPASGADISLLAGATAGAAQLDAFEQLYLAQGTLYDDLLAQFVQNRGGPVGATKATYLAALSQMTADARYQLDQAILFKEVRAGGRTAAAPGPGHDDYTRAFAAIETLFPGSTASAETGSAYAGDISLFFSRVYTLDGGNISFVAPGGEINVGLATPPAAFGVTKLASSLGIVAQREGDITSISYSDFQVNESRVFAADGGNILVWSTQGDIDAGRGAKTAIAAPPPTITFNAAGNPVATFPAALTGSGIQALSTSEGTRAGSVDLFAPRGVVNAGDAGIVAGDLTIGATAVLGADNIKVTGVSVGVPVDTGGFGAALSGVSAVASGATNAAQESALPARQAETSNTPLADQALGFLDVFITGFGDQCDPAKEKCEQQGQRQ